MKINSSHYVGARNLTSKCCCLWIGGKVFVKPAFKSFYGVAVYHFSREPIPYIYHAVEKVIFGFMRVEGFANNFAAVATCII